MSELSLTDAQRIDWLRLIRTDGVGPANFRRLVNQFGGAGAALERLPDLLRRRGLKPVAIPNRAEAEREIEALRRLGAILVARGEPGYPTPLAAIEHAPPLIAVRGSIEVLRRPAIAVVGSRNASAAGGAFTQRLAAELGREGYVVVSGLARGIDTRAHRAALATGTVAVLAGGHDRVYPAENAPLIDAIVAEGGAVLTEMPLGWEPGGRDFPRRNRIVSGLAYGVVVVEAARRSGSLITARMALEQGREVFAVPGSPLDPRAEGTNDLIRSGATLCAAAEHVTAVLTPLLSAETFAARDELGEPAPGHDLAERLWDELDLFGEEPPREPQLFREEPEPPPVALTAREHVLALLGLSPVPLDDLVRQSGLPPRELQPLLAELELAGRIERQGGLVTLAALRPR
ncbi:MAG: DNA-protecting protein DprA [Methylobacteriaceae bacterium]|nr:DNA-protecting protein DprA [Methylobacteriaceae bacterium]